MNKELIIIVVGRILQIIIMLLSIRIMTTLLSPKEVGNYYIVTTILAFFNLVFLNPPGMYFSRHLLHWQRSENLFNALMVFFFIICLVSIVSVPLTVGVYEFFHYSDKFSLYSLVTFILIAIIVSTLHRNILYGSNILGFRMEFVKYLILTLTIGLFISVSLVYLYESRAIIWLFGTIFSEMFMLFFIMKFFIKKNSFNFEKIKVTLTKEKVKKILIFSLPIGLTTFLMWGQNTAYRFIVDYRYSAELLGYIAVGLGISSAVFSSLESIAMQYYNPIFLKNILDASKEQRAEAWNKMAKQIVPIYIVAAFFTITMSEVLVNILLNEKFHNSYIYTMFGVGIEFFRVMTNLLSNVSQSEYRTVSTIKPYFIGFVISLGFIGMIDFGTNYFMIPFVLSISYFLVFVFMYFNMRSLLQIEYNIHIIKILILSLPFFIIYIFDSNNLNILYSFILLVGFGIYFLFVMWLIYKNNLKERVIV